MVYINFALPRDAEMPLIVGVNWNVAVCTVDVEDRDLSSRGCLSNEKIALRKSSPFAWEIIGIYL